MKSAQLSPWIEEKANRLRDRILYEYSVDVEIAGSEHKEDAIFILRAEFDYRLKTIRDEFFEGDGLIVKFKSENDLRPVYVMISHKTLNEAHDTK